MNAVSAIRIEELLNVVRPYRYIAVWRGSINEYAAVERGETLAVLPGDMLRVADVKMMPLGVPPPADAMNHPRVKWLAETVGKPPALRLFQYTFTPLKTRVIQRLENGGEFHEVAQEPAGSPVVIHAIHAYYVAYVSNSRHVYSETPGGAQAYRLAERGVLKPPQVYVHRHDKHRYEIGVRVPIDREQVRQLTATLGL
jgi:hypothetical protein